MLQKNNKPINQLFVVSLILSIYCFCLSALLEIRILLYPGIFFSFAYIFTTRKRNLFIIERDYFNFATILIIGSVLNLSITSSNIGGSFVLIANLFLSFFIIENTERIYVHARIFIYITLLFISYNLFYLNVHPKSIYESFSRNVPGYFIVIWTIFYLFISYVEKKKIRIAIPIIALSISLFLVGRSSIGVLLVISMISILVYLIKMPKFRSVLVVILLSIVISEVISNLEFIKLIYNTGFAYKGWDTPRYEIWVAYFRNISFVEIFYGRDPYSVGLIASNGGNIHNSFLKMHSRIGIGIFIFIWYWLRAIIKYLNYKQYYVVFLFILLSVRFCYDSMNFIGPLDFIYFTILIYPLKKGKALALEPSHKLNEKIKWWKVKHHFRNLRINH